ncbi:uncharacterized protein LOC107636140 [Arachis ipaensis]|uniref:uncharacterized protein LOC107636140 n=1 Tax=Arachis ipaensis TaxID=130454 RepID=UPI0007AF953D|nr:uncharacterized protein LOC107636140 [Arachis ipaensis]
MEVPRSMEAPQSVRFSVQDPYALQPGDHFGLVLTSQPLQEDNYASWSRSIRLALSGKKKLRFIDGSIAKPGSTIDHVLAESWQCTNDMVTTWLLNSISKDIAASVIYAGSAALLWQDLETRFSQSNGPRIFELKKALVTLTQDNLSVSQYFTKLKIIWEELNTFRPLAMCTCGGAKAFQSHLDKKHVLFFLMGLNDSFSNIRGQILLSDPLPPILKIFSLVLQEERQRAIGMANSIAIPQQVAFAVKSAPVAHRSQPANQYRGKGKRDRPLCTHRGLLGHTQDKCYKLHGYPPGYSQNKQRN